jgi:hypothetical protein
MGRRAKPEYEVKKSKIPNGKMYWYIVGFPNGKRTRAWFTTKEKAKAEAEERNNTLQRLGEDVAEVDHALIVMATEGTGILAPFGKTLRDAVFFLRFTPKNTRFFNPRFGIRCQSQGGIQTSPGGRRITAEALQLDAGDDEKI